MGLKSHEVKRKQCGQFVLPGYPGRMSYDSVSGLVSTQYTKHRQHVEPKFYAAVEFHKLMFLNQVMLWAWLCNQTGH